MFWMCDPKGDIRCRWIIRANISMLGTKAEAEYFNMQQRINWRIWLAETKCPVDFDNGRKSRAWSLCLSRLSLSSVPQEWFLSCPQLLPATPAHYAFLWLEPEYSCWKVGARHANVTLVSHICLVLWLSLTHSASILELKKGVQYQTTNRKQTASHRKLQ